MATAVETAPPKVQKTLDSIYVQGSRTISSAPPRPATEEEIPVIDVSGLYSEDVADRRAIAMKIKAAAENIGFFYIKNHGVPDEVIEEAKEEAFKFFRQPKETKDLVSMKQFPYFSGYIGYASVKFNNTGPVNKKESFAYQYHPDWDPMYDELPHPIDLQTLNPSILPWVRGEERVWSLTSNLPSFRRATLAYWRACLSLARRLVRAFALALDLPENFFDNLTTYPGVDGVINYYPGTRTAAAQGWSPHDEGDIGLECHTDLQCFTLLWQDLTGGLLVLNRAGEWIEAFPVPGTIVVNIADFLMRLTNGRWESTVHRVDANKAEEDRLSMPIFFGFNFNEKCSVLPSCVDEEHPAKYEPITCGDWCATRLKRGKPVGSVEPDKQ